MITQEKIPCSIIKLLSQLILNEMYGDQFGRICMWIVGLKGLKRFDCIERLTVEDLDCGLFSRGVIFTRARVLLALLSLSKMGDYS